MRDFLGRGWAFPVLPTPDGALRWAADNTKVRQSIWLILATAQGERQMLPDFGCAIHDLIFEIDSPNLRTRIEQAVRDALARWEPRIVVLEVTVAPHSEEVDHLDVRVDYRIRQLNAVDNLVYPFYLEEGRA